MKNLVLTEDIVVNYLKDDKEGAIHFLTEVQAGCRTWRDIVTPKARVIYTSVYNAYLLKNVLNAVNVPILGLETGTYHSVVIEDKEISFCLVESKFSTGSVSIILNGDFGVYICTGSFCYYDGFASAICPELKSSLNSKGLSHLFFDATYYERNESFLGYDELVEAIAKIIIQNSHQQTRITFDQFGLEMLIIDVALRVRKEIPETLIFIEVERVICLDLLEYKYLFTTNRWIANIIVESSTVFNKTLKQFNMIILKKMNHLCQNFENYFYSPNRQHVFTFFSHSNHEGCCNLINSLKPLNSIPVYSSTIDTRLIKFPKYIDFILKNQEKSEDSSLGNLDLELTPVNKINQPEITNESSNSTNSLGKGISLNLDGVTGDKKNSVTADKPVNDVNSLAIISAKQDLTQSDSKLHAKVSFKQNKDLFKKLLQFNKRFAKVSFKFKSKNKIFTSDTKLKILPTSDVIRKLFMHSIKCGRIHIRKNTEPLKSKEIDFNSGSN